MNWRSGNYPPLTLLYGISGIAAIYVLSVWLSKYPIKKIFVYWGCRSFSIMAFHFVGFKIFASLLFIFGIYTQTMLTELTPPVFLSYGLLLLFCIFGLEIPCLFSRLFSYWTTCCPFLADMLTGKWLLRYHFICESKK